MSLVVDSTISGGAITEDRGTTRLAACAATS